MEPESAIIGKALAAYAYFCCCVHDAEIRLWEGGVRLKGGVKYLIKLLVLEIFKCLISPASYALSRQYVLPPMRFALVASLLWPFFYFLHDLLVWVGSRVNPWVWQ